MIRLGGVLILLSFAGAQAAAAQDTSSRYNLICNGKYKDVTYYPDDSRPTRSEDDWTLNYRVDLIKNKWCEAICTKVLSFSSVTDTEIVFYDIVNDPDSNSVSSSIAAKLNRITGELVVKSAAVGRGGWRSDSVANLTCKKLPFTSFPQPRF